MSKNMIKIKTLYKLDPNNKYKAMNEILEGSEWVIEGKGQAYMKLNGTSCAVINGALYRRLEVKNPVIAKDLQISKGYILCDRNSSDKCYGWLPISNNDKNDAIHIKGWNNLISEHLGTSATLNGTYELIGQKVQGNDYELDNVRLVNHNDGQLIIPGEVPTDFEGLKEFLKNFEISFPGEISHVRYNGCLPEGIVWHNNGKMVKIRRSDFY